MSLIKLWLLHRLLSHASAIAYDWRRAAPLSRFTGVAGETREEIETLEGFLLDWMHRVQEIREAFRAR
ncbi:MAG: hypothetical protein ACKVPX_06055 [Myxococcaceae bacterium]